MGGADEAPGSLCPLMQRVVLTALGFLRTETECERNLGADKRSSVLRARLDLTTRRDGLKVMADGVPMEELQASSVEGAKAPDFWNRVLEKCAELFGTTTLLHEEETARCRLHQGASPGKHKDRDTDRGGVQAAEGSHRCGNPCGGGSAPQCVWLSHPESIAGAITSRPQSGQRRL